MLQSWLSLWTWNEMQAVSKKKTMKSMTGHMESESQERPMTYLRVHGVDMEKFGLNQFYSILKSSALSIKVQVLGAEEDSRVGVCSYCPLWKETSVETTVPIWKSTVHEPKTQEEGTVLLCGPIRREALQRTQDSFVASFPWPQTTHHRKR